MPRCGARVTGPLVLSALGLLGSACGGTADHSQLVATETPAVSTPQASPGALPALPPGDRAASQTGLSANGADSFSHYSGGLPSSDRLILDSANSGADLAWAIYEFSTTETAKYPVELRVNTGADGGAYWLGVGDYARGAWEYSGPYNDYGTLAVPQSGDFVSSGGHAYALVIAFDAEGESRVVVDDLVLMLSSNPPPAPPTGLNASLLPGRVRLQWTESQAEGLLGYNVYYATQPFTLPEQSTVTKANDIIVPASDTPNFEVINLTQGSVYYFRVSAVVSDQVESGLSGAVSLVASYSLSIERISSPRQYPGLWCYVDGRGFDSAPGGTSLLWDGVALAATEVKDVMPVGNGKTSLRFRVPLAAATGEMHSVEVKVGAQTTNAAQLTVIPLSMPPRAGSHVGAVLYRQWQMYGPGGLAVGADGSVYIANQEAGRVDSFTATGSTQFSVPVGNPQDLEALPDGRVLVKDGGGADLWYWAPGTGGYGGLGSLTRAIPEAALDAVYNNGAFIAWSAADGGTIYLSDDGDNVVRKFNAGAQTLVIGLGVLADPRDVEIDGNGNVVVADPGNERVYWFEPDGTLLGSYDGSADLTPDDGELGHPHGLTCVGTTVYVADRDRDRVLRLNASRQFVSEWGRSGYQDGAGTGAPDPMGVEARFWNLWGIAATSNGSLICSDTFNQRVGRYNSATGELLQGFGDYCTVPGEFVIPMSFGVQPSDGAWSVLDVATYSITQLSRANEVQGYAYLETGSDGDVFAGRMDRTPYSLTWGGGKFYFAHGWTCVTEYSDDFADYRILGTEWGGEPGHFMGALGLAWHNGELFVGDNGNDRVQVFNGASGLYGRSISLPSTDYSINNIAIDPAHNVLYVMDRPWGDESAFARFNATTGAFIDRWGPGYGLSDVFAVDENGHVYTGEWSDGFRVVKYAPPASPGNPYTQVCRMAPYGDGDGEVHNVDALAVTPDGRVLIGDSVRRQVVVLVP